MGEVGILCAHERVELIDGGVLIRMTIGPRHNACVSSATRALVRAAGDAGIVLPQGSVRLDLYNEPEPDLVLLKPRADFYAQSKPTPADVLLIVEVADSSVQFDRTVKVPLYARALIPIVWLVDLNADAIEVYSQPAAGTYQQTQVMHRGDRLTIDSLPGLVIKADDLLG